MNKSWIIGADGVLDWFDTVVKTPYFSVWNGRQICYSWSENDPDKGRDMLETNLRVFENNKVGDPFTLKLHPGLDKNDLITDKSPVYASLNFRVFDQYTLPAGFIAGNNLNFENNPKLQALSDKVDALAGIMEREPIEPAQTGLIANINKVLAIPGMAEQLSPLISGLTNMILKGLNIPIPENKPINTNYAGINGLSDDQETKIDQALEILEKIDPFLGDSLLKLASIAQKDPGKFKSLLSMLDMYD